MFEGFEALEAVCSQEGDRDRAWDFVRAFTAAFGRAVLEGDGVADSRLYAVEERLGAAIPQALREAYLLFGQRIDLTAAQDRFVAPEHLEVDANGVLIFRVENQHCAWWGIPAGAVNSDDPPVLVNVGDGWVPYSDRLTLALVEMVLSETMFSADERAGDNRELDDVAYAVLIEEFDRLPLPDFPFWAGMDGSSIRWFAGPDVLLRDDGGSWLWVHGRTPEALQKVRERLPGDWMMLSPGY